MKKLSKILPWLPVLAAVTPLAVSGQQTIGGILDTVDEIVYNLIYTLMAVAVLVFLWGIVKFIVAGADMEKIKEARGYIIFGLIGLLVMIAFWGIISVVLITFDIPSGGSPTLPSVPGYAD